MCGARGCALEHVEGVVALHSAGRVRVCGARGCALVHAEEVGALHSAGGSAWIKMTGEPMTGDE